MRPATRAAWDRASTRAHTRLVSAGTQGAASAVGAMDTSDGDDVVEVLNDVLESARDGEYGFQSCADHADSAELKSIFLRHLQQCAAAAQELEREIRRFGGEPASGGTVAGAVHRGWVSVKAALSSRDDKAVLEECERGEDAAVARYRKALNAALPADVRALLERQAQGAKRNHDEVRALRDSYAQR